MHASSQVALACSQSVALPTLQTPFLSVALPPALNVALLLFYSAPCQAIRFVFTAHSAFAHFGEAITAFTLAFQ